MLTDVAQPNNELPAAETRRPEDKTCVRLYRQNAEIHLMPWAGDRPGTVAGYVSRRPDECRRVSVPQWAADSLTASHATETVPLFDSPAWPLLAPRDVPQAAGSGQA